MSAGNTLTLELGGNTNLKGTVANVGGDLNIESLQDTHQGPVDRWRREGGLRLLGQRQLQPAEDRQRFRRVIVLGG
ncbi:hemagglutinin repeat-containing protein [Ralstonia solanacearum]|uniref:hemagglutinin repeat-containing protein n=1 Tax=Ralstonia solanacearum TaxID=305 RepID=UPI001F151E1F|nr:hemagglutinin repeat-containing protein [Ralstonia solanacearum]MCL9843469.1 hemagglutinin repeat-containing protein [Ralstonia solanacearum]MDC6255576.1 hemagglutinin repeat-containing protein [Ralstonia solanacearum]MDC6259963.1 hemagglutinin repeat-containing protein [Ralstonia solanacearum]MDC6304962.1 hemagglutinin repeat-containing protein [Ralstonia solanacearum]